MADAAGGLSKPAWAAADTSWPDLAETRTAGPYALPEPDNLSPGAKLADVALTRPESAGSLQITSERRPCVLSVGGRREFTSAFRYSGDMGPGTNIASRGTSVLLPTLNCAASWSRHYALSCDGPAFPACGDSALRATIAAWRG
jgi:hypothetical protein